MGWVGFCIKNEDIQLDYDLSSLDAYDTTEDYQEEKYQSIPIFSLHYEMLWILG
jgi:hypothetical protein